MAGITVSAIIKDLERRTQAREMDALAQLSTSHADAVREALASLRPRAIIDLPVLLSTISREVAEAEARRPSAPAWRWALELMGLEQLSTFKRLVESGTDADEAAREAMASGPVRGLGGLGTMRAGDAAPDDDLDASLDALDDLDDEPDAAPKRRRSVKRLRSRRLVSTKRKSKPKPEPFILGGRLFDEFGAVGGDSSYRPQPPPWLINDGGDPDEDDPDEEGERECLQPTI